LARSLRFGTRLPTLAIDSQSRRPLESTVANGRAPSQPLHVRHLGAFVDARLMRRVLFQDGEDPGRRGAPVRPC
jgi:hypothetical protein